MTHPADKALGAYILAHSDTGLPIACDAAFRAGWDAAMKQRAKRAAFVPPTVEEVNAFHLSLGRLLIYGDSVARDFWDYYTSCGWSVGKKPMKDWRAAFRRWVRSPFQQQNQPQQEMKSVNAR